MNVTNDMLASALNSVASRVRSGRCEITQEQRDSIFESIAGCIDVPISKEQACGMLHISRSTFDARVAAGRYPEGRHRRGFKEKYWYQRELI